MKLKFKGKLLVGLLASSMAFGMCTPGVFAAKTYLHEVLKDEDNPPSLEEVKRIVSKHPEVG